MKKLLALLLLLFALPAAAEELQYAPVAGGGGGSYTGITSVPSDSILGNNTGSTANAIALTVSQVNALLGTVPYSGATGNVNLGLWELYASAVGTDNLFGHTDGHNYIHYDDTSGSGNVTLGDLTNSYATYQLGIIQAGAQPGFLFTGTSGEYMNFQSGFLALNGDSSYGQIQFNNYPDTDSFANMGIAGSDGEIISGSSAGSFNISTNGGSINFSTDGGLGINMSLGNTYGGLTVVDNQSSTLNVGGGTTTAFVVQPGAGINAASFTNYGATQNVNIFDGTSALKINDGNAVPSYVWTSTDYDGNGEWEAAGGGSTQFTENSGSPYDYLQPTNNNRLLIDPTNTISDDGSSTLQTYGQNSFTDNYGGSIYTGGGIATLFITPPNYTYGISTTDMNGNNFAAATGYQAVATSSYRGYANLNDQNQDALLYLYSSQSGIEVLGGGYSNETGIQITGGYSGVGISVGFDINGYLANIVDTTNDASAFFTQNNNPGFQAKIIPTEDYIHGGLAAFSSTDGTTDTTLNDGTNAVTAFGNIDATSYSVSGTAGVSCAAGTVNLVTFTIVNGIVTHC